MNDEVKLARKMSLTEQQIFIADICERCRYQFEEHRGEIANRTLLILTKEECEKLEVISRTINYFQVNGVEDLIREKILKGGRKRGK